MATLPKAPLTKPEATAPSGVVGIARARFVRGSARKTRDVARLIKDRPVTQAVAVLAATNKRPAAVLSKVLKAALANTLQRHPQLTPHGLRIARIVVNEGPMAKRFRAAAMGRATRIRKRTSHITIELTTHHGP